MLAERADARNVDGVLPTKHDRECPAGSALRSIDLNAQQQPVETPVLVTVSAHDWHRP